MTDPERLESGLGDLLRRTNWQGPAPTDPEPLGAEEQARWQSLLDEPAPAQPASRRIPIGLIGATGLVAAVLVVAVGINSVRNGQRSQPVAEPVAPPSTPVRPLLRSKPAPESAPRTAPEATPRLEPLKAAPSRPLGPALKPAIPGTRTTTIASARETSGAPAIPPPPPAPSPIAPQSATSRPLQPEPAASQDESQIGSISVPGSDSKASGNILDEVNVAATRRANRASDSAPASTSGNQATERQQAEKISATGAAPLSERRTVPGVAAISVAHLELTASGLEATAANALRAQLAAVTLPIGSSGVAVFELVVKAGRVEDVRLIEEDSTIKDPTVINAIRGRLFAWMPPMTNLKSRIVLRVQP